MKKLLFATTAVAGFAMFATPVAAQGLSLDLGGFYRGYGLWQRNDIPNSNLRNLDFRHDSEVHFTGEVTLDNGLTVGVHSEISLGNEVAGTTAVASHDTTDETYVYFSGNWGRINFGREDGAQYLLQVAAPSADSNVDGLRTYFQGLNANPGGSRIGAILPGGGPGTAGAKGFDYANDMARYANKITYFTPKFNGFQGGVTYAPEVQNGLKAVNNGVGGMAATNSGGNLKNLWELGARWDGQFEDVGISLGAGWGRASADVSAPGAGTAGGKTRTQWNIGSNLSFNQFSAGIAYARDNHGVSTGTGATGFDRERTWVFGLGWENGPWNAGVSYMDKEFQFAGATDVDYERWTFGAGYQFGPGMSFRGAIAFGDFDGDLNGTGGAGDNRDFRQFTLGTEVNF
ncbi:MAG: porin [Micavibrio sp.]|nr:MAG: porin [Micavibrio sp.]